jgi:hypothetical protein
MAADFMVLWAPRVDSRLADIVSREVLHAARRALWCYPGDLRMAG